ncbi:MAG: ABC transporter permease [Ndongobacter sp.]|nr:ABC transporter permease [Ndongobacter sp.]
MRSRDLFLMAARNLFRRKSRTLLTILSVVIGATSIITMVSLGLGIQRQQDKWLTQLDSLTTLQVSPSAYYEEGMSGPKPTKGLITKKTIQELKKLPHVASVLPIRDVPVQIDLGEDKVELWASVQAVDFSELSEKDRAMSDGEIPAKDAKLGFVLGSFTYPTKVKQGNFEDLMDYDWNRKKIKFIIGYRDDTQAIMSGNSVKTYKELPAKYYGRLQSPHSLSGMGVYISMEMADQIDKERAELERKQSQAAGETALKTNRKKEVYYSRVLVMADKMENVDELKTTITDTYSLSVYNESEFIKSQQSATQSIQLLLGGIGAIAMIVAAIGITNTMLMSIYERTKEIGVLKVIGARIKDIRRLFLMEAGLIGVIGGTLGVLVSYGASSVINSLTASQMSAGFASEGLSYIPVGLVIIGIAFSGAVGLLAGYMPARRATRLSAIEALRTN